MIADPWFYAMAIPSVMIIGLSKGGFAGAGALAVPLMATVASPLQSTAVLLPILLALDVVAVWNYRRSFDRTTLVITLPPSLIGIAVGWAIAAHVEPAYFRILVGIVGTAFTLSVWLRRPSAEGRGHSVPRGAFWGAVTGFTSFVTLTGAPPYQMYLLPLRLDHRVYAGTFMIFMALNNVFKVGPFIMLDQITSATLWTSAALFPLALAFTLFGIWAVRRVSAGVFYRLIHVLLFVVSLKLIWDGTSQILLG